MTQKFDDAQILSVTLGGNIVTLVGGGNHQHFSCPAPLKGSHSYKGGFQKIQNYFWKWLLVVSLKNYIISTVRCSYSQSIQGSHPSITHLGLIVPICSIWPWQTRPKWKLMKLEESEWKWMNVDEIGCNWMKFDVIGLNWIKLDEIGWKWMKVEESWWKWMKVDESGWKWMKGDESG